MSVLSKNNERIAKNSIMLYFRMVLLMVISLYTSRVTLSVLGVDDFGLYQVVSGIIVVFSFLSASLSSSTQRFLNYEMGLSNAKGMRNVFSNSFFLHIIVALIAVLLGELIGVWFLNTKLVFSADRIQAANLIFQFTIFSFAFGVLSVPFHATIVAHEKMSAFAYISIVEAILKLVVVGVLSIVSCDKLVLYGALILLISIVIQFIYWIYCYKNFPECKITVSLVNREEMSKLASFSGWSLLGGARSVCHTQGISILMNLFFGVVVNAAQGITNQVTVTVNNVVNNFLMALNPQIVQLYAAKKRSELHVLMIRGCRIAIFLVAIISVPLLLETEMVLQLWLKEVPEYTVKFVKLALLAVLIQPYATVLQTSKAATGDVKMYHIVLAVIGLSHLPLAYYAFSVGLPPYSAMVIYVVLIVFIQIARIIFACRATGLKMSLFLREITKCYSLVLISVVPAFLLRMNMQTDCYSALLVCLVYILTGGVVFFCLGFPKDEREKIFRVVASKIGRTQKDVTETFKCDKRFYIDSRNMDRLTTKKIKKYKIEKIMIGKILRDLSYRKKGIVNLNDTFVYAYLNGDEKGLRKYQEYCQICNVNFRSKNEYDKLIKELSLNNYDILKGAICVDYNNLILEGQHRACIILKKYGPRYKIPVVKILYNEKMSLKGMIKLAIAKIKNMLFLLRN